MPGCSARSTRIASTVDADRGVFMVIDGVGGQAAGGKAADVARAILKEQLGAGDGSAADRLRDGITAANNEIYRLAATRAEWDGMACVLTVAVVENGEGDLRPRRRHAAVQAARRTASKS